MLISILLEPGDVKAKPGSTQWQSACMKLPYVWALPYKMRDQIGFTIDAGRAIASRWIVVTGPQGLAALEKLGLHIRDSKCSYTALIAASVQMVGGQRVVIAPPLQAMRSYGRTMRFIYRRSMDRLLRPASYFNPPAFQWTHIHSGTQAHYADQFTEACSPAAVSAGTAPLLISVDLETTKIMHTIDAHGVERKWGACITVAGYTFVYYRQGQWYFDTYTQEFKSFEDYELLRTVAALPIHKTMHNGQYDQTYFTRWNIPILRYTHDTQDWLKSVTPHMKMRSRGKETKGFYSLQAASNLYLLDSSYWKDGRQTTGMDYFRYCAMDCHRTAGIAVAQMMHTTKETFNNYCMSAYLRPVCQVAGLRGFRILEDERNAARESYLLRMREAEDWVRKATGFGPNQSAELLPLMAAISQYAIEAKLPGARMVTDTSKESLRDISDWHPLFAILAETIRDARQTSKWLSTYILKPGWSAANHNGGVTRDTLAASPDVPNAGGWGPNGEYLLYKLDPFGTDSRRLASSASNLWTGYNGQNVPGGLRKMFGGYPGCDLGSSDLSAAETRTTAYLSRCNTMREAVEGDRDFHSANSEFFFGIPYEEIYDDEAAASDDPAVRAKAVLNKPVRQLGKKINHAANYMMGVRVFIENTGIRAVLEIQRMLNLPVDWSPPKVVQYLLDRFDARFHEVRNDWANEQAIEVLTTGRLLCATGYRPLFLESPMHSKSVLNQCVATESQHLSAQIALRIFHNLWLAEQANPELLYVLLQIHDENMFGWPTTADPDTDAELRSELTTIYLAAADAKMDFDFNWADGSKACLRIPADPPLFGSRWYDVKG